MTEPDLTAETTTRDGDGRPGLPPSEVVPEDQPRRTDRAGEPEDLEKLRARAGERDQFLELLRRRRADFENYQKRARRAREEERRYQHGRLVLDLLPVLDDLERALAAARQAGDSGPLAQGVGLVRNTFLGVLRRYGVTPVEALGQPFDPNLHHAVMTRAAAGQPPNSVAQVVKQGYRIHGRLLRPAEVVVTMPAAPDSQDPKGVAAIIPEEENMVLFPNQTIVHPADVRERVKKEYQEPARRAVPPPGVDPRSWDVVDQASWDSFPASDAPPWTLGYTGPAAAG